MNMKELMILGTFHMESNADVHNVDGTEKVFEMKKEFDELVDKLSKYKPTKIFVEYEKTNQDKLDSLYNEYLEKEIKSTNEIVQIAFPLAKKNECDVIAVDWMEVGAATKCCGDVCDELNNYPDLNEEIRKYEMNHVVLENGLLPNLIMLNDSKASSNTKAFYINYARIGVDEYYGMGWLIWWYQRNLNIFANISDKLIDGDRAVLLIGAAHKGLLEEFFIDSKTTEIVDVLKYL